MFNNLIESSSHTREFKRRGSFVLFTTVTYAFLFTITGVASIYAYDAQLGDQSYEITWLPPVNLTTDEAPRRAVADTSRTTERSRGPQIAERAIAMSKVNDPVIPREISAKPNTNPPVPDGPYRITSRNYDPVGGAGTGPAINGAGVASGPVRVRLDDAEPPPTPPAPTVKKVLNTSRVLNSEALSLPKPVYPIMARQIHLQGTVNVQVLIDEKGNVISAKAVSGHPLLILEAQRAAMRARFSPTVLGDQPVKVSGLITYNFVMQ